MAKGQKHSNREARKPKKTAAERGTAAAAQTAARFGQPATNVGKKK